MYLLNKLFILYMYIDFLSKLFSLKCAVRARLIGQSRVTTGGNLN